MKMANLSLQLWSFRKTLRSRCINSNVSLKQYCNYFYNMMVFGVVLSYNVNDVTYISALHDQPYFILAELQTKEKLSNRSRAQDRKKHPFCVYFLSFIYSSEVPVFCLWREQAGRERLSKSVLQTWLAQQQIQTSSWGMKCKLLLNRNYVLFSRLCNAWLYSHLHITRHLVMECRPLKTC